MFWCAALREDFPLNLLMPQLINQAQTGADDTEPKTEHKILLHKVIASWGSLSWITTQNQSNNAHALSIRELLFFHDSQISLSLSQAKVPPGYSPLVYLSTRCPLAVYFNFNGVPPSYCVTVGLPQSKCSCRWAWAVVPIAVWSVVMCWANALSEGDESTGHLRGRDWNV